MSKPKRPRDPNQLAKLVIDIATGEVEERPSLHNERKSKAGAVGGPARAATLSAEQRREIARAAAQARWKKAR